MASSPIKKSKSSVPRFCPRCPLLDPAEPDDKNDGFDGAAGLLDELPGACRVAIAVGNTNDGESLPANLYGQPVNMRGCIPHFGVTGAIVNDCSKLAGHPRQHVFGEVPI